jgi:hypothetical protein
MVWVRRRWGDGLFWAGQISDEALRSETLTGILQRGWDDETGRPIPELEEAARAAGFAVELERMLDPGADGGDGL